MAKVSQELQDKARELMRGEMQPSDGVLYCTTDYVGNAGTAYVRVFVVRANHIYNVTHTVAHAIGDTPKDREGKWYIKTTGWGYSRAQHIADALSWALYGESGGVSYREL